METIITSGNLNGDSSGLPDREVVRQAQKNLSMNAKFWVLIKHNRIPYKIVDTKLVEASYTESVKGLKDTFFQTKIYWLTDDEVTRIQGAFNVEDEALKTSEAAKYNIDLFKIDFDKKKGE